MVSILVVTHYSLGAAYCEIVRHFFGQHMPSDFVITTSCEDGQTGLLEKVKDALNKAPENRPVLLLTDVLGSTPCNMLQQLESTHPITIVAGLNVPMLVKALQDAQKYESATLLAREVVHRAKQGIVSFDLLQHSYEARH